jgi:hypothetical protein
MMKPQKRFCVVLPSGECRAITRFHDDATTAAIYHGGTVIECIILPTADLERLVRAARDGYKATTWLAKEGITPAERQWAEQAAAKQEPALAPFTGNVDQTGKDVAK